MKIKNNTKANLQFYARMNPGEMVESINQFGNRVITPVKPEVKLVHIPGGATVVIEDDIYNCLMNTSTVVYGFRDEVTLIEGADIAMAGEKLSVTTRYQDGTSRTVNLFKQHIKDHKLIIIDDEVEQVLSNEEMISELAGMGLTVADGMSSSQIQNLYRRFKGLDV